MLKRQQAVAIFQARRYMVENALAIIDDVIGISMPRKASLSPTTRRRS